MNQDLRYLHHSLKKQNSKKIRKFKKIKNIDKKILLKVFAYNNKKILKKW